MIRVVAATTPLRGASSSSAWPSAYAKMPLVVAMAPGLARGATEPRCTDLDALPSSPHLSDLYAKSV